jgi:hypothetical protein
MREALLGGATDPAPLAALARGRRRATRARLEQAGGGHVTAPHACLISEPRRPLDDREAALARGRAAIAQR